MPSKVPLFNNNLTQPKLPVATSSKPLGISQQQAAVNQNAQIWRDYYQKQRESGLRYNFTNKPSADPAIQDWIARYNQQRQQERDASYARSEQEAQTARNSLLAGRLTPQILAEHGYPNTSVDEFARDLNTRVLNAKTREDKRRLVAEAAGNFAQVPDTEIMALDRWREGIQHELGDYYGSGGQSTAGMHLPNRGALDTAERAIKDLGSSFAPLFSKGVMSYSGDLQRADDPEHQFSPNLMATSPVKSRSRDANLGMQPITPMVAKTFSPGVSGEPWDVSSDSVSGAHMILPYTFDRGELIEGNGGDFRTNGVTRAHEMYHHKMNNFFKSHPYLQELQGHLTEEDNEHLADVYAQQAPVSDADTASWASKFTDAADIQDAMYPEGTERPADTHAAHRDRSAYHFIGPRR